MSARGEDFVEWAWDAVEGATGYEGDAFLEASPDTVTRFQTTEPTYRYENLPPDAEASIFLRAVRETAGGRTESEWAGRFSASTLAPPPRPPVLRVVAEVWTRPSDAGGYAVGERIWVVLRSSESTTVEGSPRLAIEIGEHVRLADFSPWVEDDFPPERPSWLQRFEYRVALDDADADGISIEADALDFSEGAFLNDAGVEVEVEIRAVGPARDAPDPVDPGQPLGTQQVLGAPEPRICTDERERALRFHPERGGPVVVKEWDGTPIRVDLIHNFPDSVTEADVADLLDAVGLLADKIEDQLGYRILEEGDVIPVPEGMRPGWNEDGTEFWNTCPLPRERGQIQGFFMDHIVDWHPTSDGQAHPPCGDYAYNRPFVTYWPCRGCEDERTPDPYNHYVDGLTHHEIFHLLGFIHTEDDERIARREGVPMTWTLRASQGPGAEAVLWQDIDALRCIFPEGGR
ncbi:MAG: hypothetical protein F4Z74_01040 [Acidobacteria bacterium]|nr:hypothetical protein [Acidobacteriota bacterium]